MSGNRSTGMRATVATPTTVMIRQIMMMKNGYLMAKPDITVPLQPSSTPRSPSGLALVYEFSWLVGAQIAHDHLIASLTPLMISTRVGSSTPVCMSRGCTRPDESTASTIARQHWSDRLRQPVRSGRWDCSEPPASHPHTCPARACNRCWERRIRPASCWLSGQGSR